MSSPEPPLPGGSGNPSPGESGGTVGDAWRGIQGMNRWVLLTIVAIIILIVWYFYWHRDNSSSSEVRDDPSADWESRARKILAERGYPQNQIDSALDHYLRGGTMSVEDQAVIAVVIRAIGTPDFPNPQPNSQNMGLGGPVTPSGPVSSGNTGSAPTQSEPGEQTYWYVVSTGVGMTSSLRGIAQQYYGSSNLAVNLLPYNPDIGTVNERIPPGKVVKVPRSLNV